MFSIKVLFDDRGKLVVEYSELPEEYFSECIKHIGDANDLRLIKREFDRRFKGFNAEAQKLLAVT
jgi:hypothetical protein